MTNPTSLSEYVQNEGTHRAYPADQTLFSPTEICRELYVVLSGHLNITRPLSSGEVLLIRQVRAGELFGEVLLFSEHPFSGWITTGAATEIAALSKSRAEKLLVGDATFRRLFFREISRRVKHLGDRAEILSRRTVEERLRLWLDQHGGVSRCSRQEAADQLGCSREALSRCLSELVREREIRAPRGRIERIQKKSNTM